MGTNIGGIDAVQVPVHAPLRVGGLLPFLQHPAPGAILLPAPEARVDRDPRLERSGQIAPRTPGALPPENAVEHVAGGPSRPTTAGALRRQQRLQVLPLVIGQGLGTHPFSLYRIDKHVPRNHPDSV